MEREIPNLNKLTFLSTLMGTDRTEEKYIEKIESFERKVEQSLIETFQKLNINGSVKTDPYSLPYKDEILVTLYGESYWGGVFEIFRVAPVIVKELLNKNIENIRFYMYINAIYDFKESDSFELKMVNSFGKIEYRFRYYEQIKTF